MNAAPESPPALETVKRPEIVELSGLRLRALLVGLPLMIGICLLSLYADMVSKVVQFGVLQLAPPAVAALFGLAIINRGLARLFKREWLSRGDILVIYAMLLTGAMVSTRGVIEKLIPPLAYLPYYANRENKLNEVVGQHLPGWALPYTPSAAAGNAPPALSAYYDGLAPGQQIPFQIWVGPLVAWFGLIACVLWTFLCLATILRRQWVENEQLRFPLTTVPLAIIKNESEGQPFFQNRVMWAGFAFAAIVFGINGLSANYPDVPAFALNVNLKPYFSERPWNQMDGISIYLSLAAVGFAFFLPVELLFSLWFFFLMTRLQDVAAVQLGGVPTSIGTHNARVFTGYQAAGAYLVLVAAQARIGWPYFKEVWRTAFGPKDRRPLDDSNELMPYRAAIIGIILGFGGIILWLALAGMNPILAAAQMGIYIFFIAFIMSRGVAEAGLLMTETSFLPSHLISLVYPLPSLGATNLSVMALTNVVFTRDLRGVMLSPFLDDLKMAKEVGLKPRSLLIPLAVGMVVAFVVSAYFFLHLNYTKGGLSLYDYPNGNAGNMFNLARGQINGSTPGPDSTSYGGFGVGVVVTMLLVWARSSFTWFPLHPLGYALAPTWAMLVLWFPFFVAWMGKSAILRFGGIETFRKVAPFMLGMIMGEFSSAVMWALLNMWKGWNTPQFPWP